MRKNKNEKGFTILELMITISIIGIISAIAAAPLMNVVKKARLMADIRTVQSAQGQIEFYKMEHEGKFPGAGNGAGQTNISENNPEVGTETWKVLVDKNYLRKQDMMNDKLALQTKMQTNGEIKIKYDTDDNQLFMDIPKPKNDNKSDSELIVLIQELQETKDRTWCKLEGKSLSEKNNVVEH